MRILVHELVSGGGLAGRDVPASLAREGAAMLAALVEDLAALGAHRIVTTADARFPPRVPHAVDVVALPAGDATTLDALIASADAVWLIAPETGRCLEGLAARVERLGTLLLGSGSAVIARASDKASLGRWLARRGLPYPRTSVLLDGVEPLVVASDLGYPVVVKPARGAGCEGVTLAREGRELRLAVEGARLAAGSGPVLLQQYVRGVAASVSLVADGRRALPLAVNAQRMGASRRFTYGGGRTPFEHPLASQAADVAQRACEAVGGLKGCVGVDLVLGDDGPVVIEVNPRLTTSYLGIRAAVDDNVAALALAACGGTLPEPPTLRRQVVFSASGRVVSAAALPVAVA